MSSRLETLIAHLENTTFFLDPASTKYHQSFKGGLFDHSLRVQRHMLDLTRKHGLKWSDPESIRIISLCHDLCKVGAYEIVGEGEYKHRKDHPEGHGDLSLKLANAIITLTEEEQQCIRWHMGAYDHKDNWKVFENVLKGNPNVYWTHVADMTATHMDDGKKLTWDDHCNVCTVETEIFNFTDLILSLEYHTGFAIDDVNEYLQKKEDWYDGRSAHLWPEYSEAHKLEFDLRSVKTHVKQLKHLEGLD